MVALSSIYFNEGHSDAIAKGGIIKDSHIGVCNKSELKIQIKKPTINAIKSLIYQIQKSTCFTQ